MGPKVDDGWWEEERPACKRCSIMISWECHDNNKGYCEICAEYRELDDKDW